MRSYLFQTSRLGFSLLQKTDLDYLAALHSDADVRYFFPTGVLTRDQTQAWMNEFDGYYQEKGLPCFMMFELDTQMFVGRSVFGPVDVNTVEVGYVLHKEFWNKGYATEALKAILQWAKKNMDAHAIVAMTPVEHLASQRVMQKAGMKYHQQQQAKGVLCHLYRIENRSVVDECSDEEYFVECIV